MRRLGMLALALALSWATAASAASLAKGTIHGEVKAIQPGVVVVQEESEGQEVRLPLHPSTHMGPIQAGDRVEAFVTPGGTTTSIQPLDSRLYR